MDIREQMDNIYRDIPPEDIPWNLTEPPGLLVDAVRSGQFKPCKAIDLGCGAGNYAVWMAAQGFDVTGIDISEKAITMAREMAAKRKVECRFEVVDLLGDVGKFHSGFDLAYDWELLHHVFPDDRQCYLENVHQLLRPDGRYFSVCFSDRDGAFGGEGKFRKTRLGTILYFSSEDELTGLFKPRFKILELRTVEIPGKYGTHMANVAWLERR